MIGKDNNDSYKKDEKITLNLTAIVRAIDRQRE